MQGKAVSLQICSIMIGRKFDMECTAKTTGEEDRRHEPITVVVVDIDIKHEVTKFSRSILLTEPHNLGGILKGMAVASWHK